MFYLNPSYLILIINFFIILYIYCIFDPKF